MILGGIHVSTSPEDVGTFIRNHVPHPQLVSQVHGPGDSAVIDQIMVDLGKSCLKSEYSGQQAIEDGVWGREGVIPLPQMPLE